MLKKIYESIVILTVVMTMLLAGSVYAAESNERAVEAENVKGNLTIKVLNVGKGDALLIQTDSQTILIDTGVNKFPYGVHKGEVSNLLFEVLAKENINHIDRLMMSHPHADHIGKAAEVIKKYNVGELIYNGIPFSSKNFRNAFKAAKERNIRITAVKEGDTLDFGNGALFSVLSPSSELLNNHLTATQNGEEVRINDESIVGKLTYGKFSMLFTGDSEREAEEELLYKYGNRLSSNVYKVPHHGNRTSSMAEYVRAINPQWAVISCGEKWPGRAPHEETLKTLNSQNIKIMQTNINGTITITSDGNFYSVNGEIVK